MAGLVHQVTTTGLSLPLLRAAADGTVISFSSGGAHGRHRRRGMVVAAAHVAARPKYCRLRGVAAVAAPETSRQQLIDQHVRPSGTASSKKLATIRFDRASISNFAGRLLHGSRKLMPWIYAC